MPVFAAGCAKQWVLVAIVHFLSLHAICLILDFPLLAGARCTWSFSCILGDSVLCLLCAHILIHSDGRQRCTWLSSGEWIVRGEVNSN